MNTKNTDTIYAEFKTSIGDFVFDEKVAEVFDDMITRSVPGYHSIIGMIGVLAGQHVKDHSCCYDLGCSLGAATAAMCRQIAKKNCRITAVDNSKVMLAQCRLRVEQLHSIVPVEYLLKDIRDVQIENAGLVVLNFTLQFVDPSERFKLIKNVYEGLQEGGILILSEKIAFRDSKQQAFAEELYHTFKRLNGYSDLEISQKRTALENILIPDTLEEHQHRLLQAGFNEVNVWFQCINFMSLVAVK